MIAPEHAALIAKLRSETDNSDLIAGVETLTGEHARMKAALQEIEAAVGMANYFGAIATIARRGLGPKVGS